MTSEPVTLPETGRQFVTLKQALEYRPWLTERWLRNAAQNHWIPYYKVGWKLIFDLAELDDYVERCRVEAVAPQPAALSKTPPKNLAQRAKIATEETGQTTAAPVMNSTTAAKTTKQVPRGRADPDAPAKRP